LPILLDKDIRGIFTTHHEKRYPKSNLLSEVRINNGLAIADLVSIGIKTTHCYEIKSDKDKIARVLEQSKSYDIVFNKISLITTSIHYEKALNIIPSYWGIIIVSNISKSKVHYCRKAVYSPYFSKHKALSTLWRDELLNIIMMKNIKEKSVNRLSRGNLIEVLCNNLSTTEICRLMNYYLLFRQRYSHKIDWFK
jgi:hypothetical protein